MTQSWLKKKLEEMFPHSKECKENNKKLNKVGMEFGDMCLCDRQEKIDEILSLLQDFAQEMRLERKYRSSIVYLTNPPQYPPENSQDFCDGYNQAISDFDSKVKELLQ